MWIKTQDGDWLDTSEICAVTKIGNNFTKDKQVRAITRSGYGYIVLAHFKTDADAQTYADEFVAKYLKEDSHVD